MRNGSNQTSRIVRFCSRSYGYERVCYRLPIEQYGFRHARAVPVRRILRRSHFWSGARWFFPPLSELVHSFNDLVIGASRWVVSHELELPRFLGASQPGPERAALDRLASERCRRILPMSEAARRWFLRRTPQEYRETLAEKSQVFVGGVNGPDRFGISQLHKPRASDEPLHLVFVGNNAFRKGGPYVLDAFDALRAAGVNVRLTFIGNVDPFSYVIPVTPEAHTALIKRLNETAGVTWLHCVPNRVVMETLAEAHVGLLPTLDDSLGWSVIEMMSAGLPVIASGIVAIPELMTDGVTGRLIDLPCDEDGRWIGVVQARDDGDVQREARDRLVNGLIETIGAWANDEDMRLKLGTAGRVEYEKRFTPAIAAKELSEIYDAAMA